VSRPSGPVRSRAVPTAASSWRTWLVWMAFLTPSWKAAWLRLGWPERVRSLRMRMRCSAPGRVNAFQTSVENAPGPPRAARGVPHAYPPGLAEGAAELEDLAVQPSSHETYRLRRGAAGISAAINIKPLCTHPALRWSRRR
jgi:hypothetical protein